jgi:hypothetical protein
VLRKIAEAAEVYLISTATGKTNTKINEVKRK